MAAETVVFGLDVVQFVTTVSALVSTALVSYISYKVRQGVNEIIRTIEENRERTQRHNRIIFGTEAVPGLIDRVDRVEQETDA